MANPTNCSRFNFALVSRIANSFKDCSSFELKHGCAVDIDHARREHGTLVETLQKIGVDVIELPCDEKHPDGLFVDDIAVVINNTALICNPPTTKDKPSRQGEVSLHAGWTCWGCSWQWERPSLPDSPPPWSGLVWVLASLHNKEVSHRKTRWGVTLTIPTSTIHSWCMVYVDIIGVTWCQCLTLPCWKLLRKSDLDRVKLWRPEFKPAQANPLTGRPDCLIPVCWAARPQRGLGRPSSI